MPELKEFYLVGGTALALQMGHRNSIDIDLFTLNEFDEEELFNSLNRHYVVKEIYRRKHTIISLLNNIKTDFIRHNYPLIKPTITEEGITFLSLEDIAAMKLHAIIQSGKRLKDFIDIYFLLQHFSMQQLIDFFTQKYTYSNPMIAMKALIFFDDIDENTDPPKLLTPLPVEKIKKRIREATLKPDKIFN
ncbi:MAG TPA: nucleotidyl transferase AbiEii/AbiGii toxin family protein [Chitinophagaceae bacterium]|nr:nucleotidyl transferase AbiEii/AbiGii toxin family protein [Chitinophagaceae bacterium]